jgi:hypothetical protein
MSSVAVVCPHCGARRGDVATGVAGKTLSPAEIRALALSNMMFNPPPPSMLSALVLPHAATSGAARTAELVLTLASLPLVAVGALTLAVTRRRSRGKYDAMDGELAPVITMLGVGGLGFSSVLSMLGASLATNLAVTAASAVALIARGVIRARAAAARSRELERLDRA